MLDKIKNIPMFSFVTVLFLLGIFSNLSASSIKEVKFKGWFDTEYISIDTSGSRPFFDTHHLYLIAEVNLEENFSGLFEIEVEHAPNTSAEKGTINLDRSYIQKKFSRGLGIRAGKFSTPFGYWIPTHWSILVETISSPVHENNHYIPSKSVGVQAYGLIFTENHEIEWNLYFTNGSESEDTDNPEDASFGGGADARINFSDGETFLGLSYYHQKNPSHEGRRENSVVGYLGTQLGDFNFRSEYVTQTRSIGNNNTIFNDVSTYYISGKYLINSDFAIGTRFDYGDDERNHEDEAHKINSLFLNWTPIPEIIGKVEYDIHRSDIDDHTDYNVWAFYIGLIF